MPWLESWARAVVHASKTDTSERIRQRGAPKSGARSEIPGTVAGERGARTRTQGATAHDDDREHDASQGGEKVVDRGRRSRFGSVQDRREDMKATVREGYAFSSTATLWAREMTGESADKRPRGTLLLNP